MYSTTAFAKKSPQGPFEKIEIKRGNTGDDDVEISIKYCGVCHGDVNFSENDFNNALYPIVPGHEIAGIVTEVGKNVSDISVGDRVGIGFIVDCCMQCEYCRKGDEIGCEPGHTKTFNFITKHGHITTDSGYTYGGYSGRMSVHRRFAIKIPDGYPLEAAGSVFCAGITMFTPLKRFRAIEGGMKVGIVGIGGLGQMGVQLAKAMGNEVTAISTSSNKEQMARKIGADHFVISKDKSSMEKAAKSLNLILNTVSADHDMMQYATLLKRKGVLVQLGVVTKPLSFNQLLMLNSECCIAGSTIGTIQDTQECINFCAKNSIVAETELISWEKLNEVYQILHGGNDKVIRYVLDLDKSLGKI